MKRSIGITKTQNHCFPHQIQDLGFPDNVKEERILDLESGVSFSISALFSYGTSGSSGHLSMFLFEQQRQESHRRVLTAPGRELIQASHREKLTLQDPTPTYLKGV